ncbi:thiamine pyrophosphate-dependent enzyme [Desulfofundulus thermocisternus]|uniref:thiamine pyrophosphate-dependent enzyme n=1 Tax=Desulfofundulus thermocisternus TaxID=42471 RepID=UPI00217E2AD9|nr:thiamine pyrophosphate-dependent enzyme [Desulfofundulus thermocisternus]MCS5694712.1 thiamine pyrophosphate-dependent enzyme [Desulfofundulus thermocisternus]
MAPVKPLREIREKYFEKGVTIGWCPGCSLGIIGSAVARAVDDLGINPDKVAIMTGIGCNSMLGAHLRFNELHGAHGRAVAMGTGLKAARPDLTVIVFSGDGDGLGIGGNHMIHAARRNIDLTVILINNQIYGNTGGQMAPTTCFGDYTSTSPYGSPENSFDACRLMEAAGATFIARGCTYYALELKDLIAKAISHRGFSFVEVDSPCPTHYGKFQKLGGAVEMIRRQKDKYISIAAAKNKSSEELAGKLLRGVLVEKEAPEFTEEYRKVREKAGYREER